MGSEMCIRDSVVSLCYVGRFNGDSGFVVGVDSDFFKQFFKLALVSFVLAILGYIGLGLEGGGSALL